MAGLLRTMAYSNLNANTTNSYSSAFLNQSRDLYTLDENLDHENPIIKKVTFTENGQELVPQERPVTKVLDDTTVPIRPNTETEIRIDWQIYPIPDEIRLVRSGTSEEILIVVYEALDQCRTVQQSVLANLQKDRVCGFPENHAPVNVGRPRSQESTITETMLDSGSPDIQASTQSSPESIEPIKISQGLVQIVQSSSVHSDCMGQQIRIPRKPLQYSQSSSVCSDSPGQNLPIVKDNSPYPNGNPPYFKNDVHFELKTATPILSKNYRCMEDSKERSYIISFQSTKAACSKLFRHYKPKPQSRSSSSMRVDPSLTSCNRRTLVVEERKECASCFDDIGTSKAINLRCQHRYCYPCFGHLIETTMHDENLWPPRCCMLDIPRPVIVKNITKQQLRQFTWKEKEFSTPAKLRWYCSSPNCGRWFPAKSSGDSAVQCPYCKYEMCMHCRGQRHSIKEPCPQDTTLQMTLQEAEKQGWRQCYNCNAFVELRSGCIHITCKCKAEFW